MHFPRRLALLLAVGALWAASPADAAKPVPLPLKIERIAPGPAPEGAAVCPMGVTGSRGAIIDFIYPPDDAYYTLLEVNDCAACATADTALFTRVHVSINFRASCEMPITIGVVNAVESTETPGCFYPNPTDFVYAPEGFLLPPRAQLPDTADLVFTLSAPARIITRAFLVVSFVDSVPGCSNNTVKPRLVLRQGSCAQCVSYNDWFGEEAPDDLCFPDQVGNPLMSVEIDSCSPLFDLIAPSTIADLGQDSTAFDAVRLTWTATGDDGPVGTASWYELRRSTSPITALNFESADSVAGVPAPAVAGTAERFVATGLAEMTTYHFAIKVHDEGGNESAVSNVLAVTTAPGIPAPVGLLEATSTTESSIRLRWRASGDDGIVGRPQRYLIAVSTSPISAANFYASLRDSIAATVDAGGQENAEIGGLSPFTDYHVAVRARDELGNVSDVVSIVARTGGGPIVGRTPPAIAPLQQPARLPVPIHWIAVPGETRNSIRIFDLTGRLVRTLPLPAAPNGVVQWDGLDDDGEDVPAGMYVAKLSSGSREAKSRIVLLK